ncbi:MAG: cation:proton antiporter [Calditrichales bacterium]|nr:cation:proton antiporter [Calditrichales bacterium]
MKKISVSILLIAIFYGIKSSFYQEGGLMAESTILTGLVLVTAYLVALILTKIKLPKLTGYMILGVILGPIGLNFLNHEILERLSFLERLALSFIALTAGGELKYERIKKYTKSILYLLSGQIIVVFAGLFVLFIGLSKYIPFISGLEDNLIMGFSILFAATAISTSPAVTIGIITELRSKGKLTDIVLSITVLKSIFLVITFPLIITWAKFYLVEGTSFNTELIKDLLSQILGSIGLGVFLGFLVIWYLKYIKVERSIFLLGVAIVITELSSMLNMEILVISIIVGIMVENFSDQGESLILGVERSSLPLYIIFFCFAGAGLHLETLRQAFVLTVFLVISRVVFLFIGNYLGALLAGEEKTIKNISWLGFIGQAGIAVGLATIIENTLPGAIGSQFKTILIASVVINELMGPIFFKYILIKSREAQTERY